MKIFVNIFLVILTISGYSQEDKIYTSLAEALKVNPEMIIKLDLSKQKLKAIPTEILTFKNLRELNLEKNKISELPENFVFDNLKVLNLSKNSLTFFPSVLCQNTSLTQLLLGKNKITKIPDCIGSLKKLIVLDVWFNPIQELPESMVELKELRVLDLRGITYSFEFQKKWNELLPWVKIEFDLGCDCGY